MQSQMQVSGSVLETIGNTPLVELRRVVPGNCARILVKVEGQNPTGSMKDRMAQAVIAHAEADGRLRTGGSVVEYTGGSTGASLALICAAKGYPLQVVTSRAFSEDKLVQMAALGARLVLVESESGKYTKALFLEMIETARKIKAETGAFWTDQLNNADAVTGYYGLGEEIWRQSEGIVDAFVQSIGTGASLSGVQAVLKRYNPGVQIVGVEPAESAVLSGGPPGAHKIEGIGIGFP